MKDTEKAAEKIANANTLGQVEAILTEYAQHHTNQVLNELIEWMEAAHMTQQTAINQAKQLRDEEETTRS
jgi:hypothetical protein